MWAKGWLPVRAQAPAPRGCRMPGRVLLAAPPAGLGLYGQGLSPGQKALMLRKEAAGAAGSSAPWRLQAPAGESDTAGASKRGLLPELEERVGAALWAERA